MIIRISLLLILFLTAFGSIAAKEIMAGEEIHNRAETAIVMSRLKKAVEDNNVIKAINLNGSATRLTDDEKNRLAKAVKECSKIDGHDPFLLLALIEVESGYDRLAVSEKGAVGLLQVMPFVARELADELNIEFGEDDTLHDMEINLKLGSYYLAKMMKRYGDTTLALEAYNLGPAKLEELLEGGRLKKRYTKKTFKIRDRLKKLAMAPVLQPTA
jgi:soluble lytic murein transglycosylase-like protein